MSHKPLLLCTAKAFFHLPITCDHDRKIKIRKFSEGQMVNFKFSEGQTRSNQINNKEQKKHLQLMNQPNSPCMRQKCLVILVKSIETLAT